MAGKWRQHKGRCTASKQCMIDQHSAQIIRSLPGWCSAWKGDGHLFFDRLTPRNWLYRARPGTGKRYPPLCCLLSILQASPANFRTALICAADNSYRLFPTQVKSECPLKGSSHRDSAQSRMLSKQSSPFKFSCWAVPLRGWLAHPWLCRVQTDWKTLSEGRLIAGWTMSPSNGANSPCSGRLPNQCPRLAGMSSMALSHMWMLLPADAMFMPWNMPDRLQDKGIKTPHWAGG